MSYFIKPGYEERTAPDYFLDDNLNAVCQPDVYPEAAALGERLGSRRIVDVGCGTAGKLAALNPRFEIVGIDFGTNIDLCRQRYDFGTWLEVDFDSDDPLPVTDLDGALLVCADVIEHLVYPHKLLRNFRSALDRGADALLLSTPERDLTWGADHAGPPLNAAHVREWNTNELRRFMASEGLDGYFGLTRTNDQLPELRTILVAVPGRGEAREQGIRRWFGDRRKWENLAADQDRAIRRQEEWSRELQQANAWLEEQRLAWQRQAEEQAEVIRSLEKANEQLRRWRPLRRIRGKLPRRGTL